MKKSLILLMILCLTVTVVGCGFNKKNKKPKGPEVGDRVEEAMLLTEEMGLFTAETLPDEYKTKDFDGDRLSNKDDYCFSKQQKCDFDGKSSHKTVQRCASACGE